MAYKTTIEFFNSVQDRCAQIASLPPSRHDAEIIKLGKDTGLTPATITPIIEKYAHQRVPDYPDLARCLVEQIGPSRVRAMLATNHGMRDLKHAVQTALADERLSVTGPRVALFVDAIKVEFHSAPPSELNVCGARTAPI